MKRFEFVIDVPAEFEINDESMDNIKSYLCYCFKVDNVDVGRYDVPDWIYEWQEQRDNTDLEIPF